MVLSILELSLQPGLVHGFSTATHGNMRRDPAHPWPQTPERSAFANALGLDGERITVAGAVHGAEVARVDQPLGQVDGVDALVTNRVGTPLLATFADCYPIVIYDPRHHAVALAHAGWRGTAAGVARNTVTKLAEEYGSRPEDLVAGIGPGICGHCYEVGREVATRFPPEFLKPSREGRQLLDLAAANRRQLVDSGLEAHNVHVHGACTLETPELYSHRRSPDGTRCACLVALTPS